MAIDTPKLDDRQFQNIVDEAKGRIHNSFPEWTDHNVSDPGVTLIELFAWMTDIILYRLNQVPRLHYIQFMKMLGMDSLAEPKAASAPVTFWLSTPLVFQLSGLEPAPVLIPTSTQVASTRTENNHSIIFTTDDEFLVSPPQLDAIVTQANSDEPEDHSLRHLVIGFFQGEGVEVFSAKPQVGDALYFGFRNDPSNHILGFDMDFEEKQGDGVVPQMPPYVWEASTGESDDGNRWQICTCDNKEDTTLGMNQAGRIRIRLPEEMGQATVDEKKLYWVRVRVKEITPEDRRRGMKPYTKSPQLRQVSVATWGGTVHATNARWVEKEALGQSDGSPGQRFQLQCTPILKQKHDDETLIVQFEDEMKQTIKQTWTRVPDFAESEPDDLHYTLDSITGELRLGPALRKSDAEFKRYGAIPPRGANLIFERYRYGGGAEGNVQVGILNTLKTAIPYIARVENWQQATGGEDVETLESAMQRAPKHLRSRDRAVTETDFEFLAEQAAREGVCSALGRVKCAQFGARGIVYILVIPDIAHPAGYLSSDQLELADKDKNALFAYLDERRMLTARLKIQKPDYIWVSVGVKLGAIPGVDQSLVKGEVETRLCGFLNPLTGGPDGNGWPFGRNLYVSDIYSCLQGVPGVQFIRSVEIYEVRDGKTKGPIESVEIKERSIIASDRHEIECVQDRAKGTRYDSGIYV